MSNNKPVAGFDKHPENINKNGRPKGISITEMVKSALEEKEPTTNTPWKELIVKKILIKAVSEGDVQLIKAIWNYIDGMPQQDITSGGEKFGLPVIYKPEKKEI